MNENQPILRPFWAALIKTTWVFGLMLIIVWGIPRFILVLSANVSGNYGLVSLVFVSMWFTPWIFLTKYGRSKIGLTKPKKIKWLFLGFFVSIMMCLVMFVSAWILFQDSVSNWFVYISNSYSNVPENLTYSDRWIFFSIYAAVSMIFSPVGEEFFYRGIVHECFAARWNDRIASIVDASAFSLTHLAHFGIIYQHPGQWSFLFLPSLVWVGFLFVTCLLFYEFRKRSGSILGAVVSHAGFNLAMIYLIFFYIL